MTKLKKVKKVVCNASYAACHIALRVAIIAFAVNTACADFGGSK